MCLPETGANEVRNLPAGARGRSAVRRVVTAHCTHCNKRGVRCTQALGFDGSQGFLAMGFDGRDGILHEPPSARTQRRLAPRIGVGAGDAFGEAGLFEQDHLADERGHGQAEAVRKARHGQAAVVRAHEKVEEGEVAEVQPVECAEVVIEPPCEAGLGVGQRQAEVERPRNRGAHGVL